MIPSWQHMHSTEEWGGKGTFIRITGKKQLVGAHTLLSPAKISGLIISRKFSFVAFAIPKMNQGRKNREKGRFPSRAKQTFPNKIQH